MIGARLIHPAFSPHQYPENVPVLLEHFRSTLPFVGLVLIQPTVSPQIQPLVPCADTVTPISEQSIPGPGGLIGKKLIRSSVRSPSKSKSRNCAYLFTESIFAASVIKKEKLKSVTILINKAKKKFCEINLYILLLFIIAHFSPFD